MLSKQALFVSLLAAALCITSCDSKKGRNQDLDDTYPYLEDQSYSEQLKRCASARDVEDSCSLERLPILGLMSKTPSIDDIMSRVLVSHDWMGERFELLLNNLPEDFLRMFRGITVVVIDDEVRPSYYYNLTGAIYLDPASLWIYPEEKDVISREPDHREGYSDPLRFRTFWRYAKDGGDAWEWHGLSSNKTRRIEDMVLPMAALLAHELAHANDLFPVAIYDQVDVSKTVYQVSEETYAQYPSTLLNDSYPLLSNEMKHLAGIMFRGNTPSDEDKETTAGEVAEYFSVDAANDDYAYSSQYEYAAMLVEEAMMKFYFDIDRDLGFIDYVEVTDNDDLDDTDNKCDIQKIAWGQRNRIGDDNVKERAEFVLERMYPELDFSDQFDALEGAINFPQGIGWCEALSYGYDQKQSAQNKLQVQGRGHTPLRPDVMRRPYAIHHDH